MTPHMQALFDRRRQRLALMRELSGVLEESLTAAFSSDPQKIENCASGQAAVCHALSQLDARCLSYKAHAELGEVLGFAQGGTTQTVVPAEAEQRWCQLGHELGQVEARVLHLNRVYGGLLRRAQRTLEIFTRLLQPSPTYVPPECGAAVGNSPER